METRDKNKIRKVAYSILLSGIFVVSSCEDFIDVGTPQTQLTGETVFEDSATADAAMANIYSKLQTDVLVTGGPNGLSVLMGAYADELVSYSNYGLPDERFFTNNVLPDDAAVLALWSDSYNLVYAANAVMEGVSNSLSLPQADKNRLLGEALFVRSYIYSYLTGLYGSIPYATITDYTVNTALSKKTTSEINQLLIADLQQAVTLLPSEYVSANRVRPNKETAMALLARIALNEGRYDLAIEASGNIIAQTSLYSLASDLDNVFLTDSPSTLWQLAPATEGLNTLEGENFIFDTTPPHTRALANALYNAFEEGDLRKEQWIGAVSDGESSYYYANKYKLMLPTGTSQEYSIQFRLEELYLIRAEAFARTGGLAQALEALNTIRSRAGLQESTAQSQEALLEAILHERRVEFFTEHGHRFFDLKRYDAATSVLEPVKPGWNPTDVLLPLPQNELNVNGNLLPQNNGY